MIATQVQSSEYQTRREHKQLEVKMHVKSGWSQSKDMAACIRQTEYTNSLKFKCRWLMTGRSPRRKAECIRKDNTKSRNQTHVAGGWSQPGIKQNVSDKTRAQTDRNLDSYGGRVVATQGQSRLFHTKQEHKQSEIKTSK